jgi:tetratricopeptide (TPR) repeat protein
MITVRPFLLFFGFIGLLVSHKCAADDPPSLNMIFELPVTDTLTIDQGTIIDRCRSLLKDRKKLTPETLAKALRARGLAYIRSAKYDDAGKDFEELSKLSPKDAEAHYYMAVVLGAQNRLDEAIDEARRAIELNPKFPNSHLVLGTFITAKGDRKGALESFNKVISLDSKYAQAYYFRAQLQLPSNPAKSLEDLNRFLELSPLYDLANREYPYYYRGLALYMLNRPKEALASLLMARKLNGKSPFVARSLGEVYAALGKYHLALHYGEQVVRADPDSPVGYALVAAYKAKIGSKKGINTAIEKALALSQSHPDYLAIVGGIYFELGDYERSLRNLDKALELKLAHYEALLYKASLLATCPKGKYRNGVEAVRLASMALKDDNLPEWGKWAPTMVLAEAHAESGNFKEAVRFAKEALERAGPDFGRRGEFLEKLSFFEKKMPYRAKIVEPVED